jgi:periplasmic divalent cation tolerance protein
MSTDALIVLCAFGNQEDAGRAAHFLVRNGLAACVNVLPEVRSVYSWQGKLADTGESLVIIKTTASGYDAVRDALLEIHEYAVPEVIALPVTAGHQPYLEWLAENSSGQPLPEDD